MDYVSGIIRPGWAKWLRVIPLVIAALVFLVLATSQESQGDVMDYTQERGSTGDNVCRSDITHYLNLTVTNKANESLNFTADATQYRSQESGKVAIDPDASHIFRFTKEIARGTPRQQYSVSFFIRAFNETAQVDQASNGFLLEVPQCAGLKLTSNKPTYSGIEEEPLNIVLILENTGNYLDDYRIVVEGLPASWRAVESERFTLQGLAAGETRDRRLAPIPRSGGTFTLTITATSLLEDQEEVTQTIQVTVTVEAKDEGRMTGGMILFVVFLLALIPIYLGARRAKQDSKGSGDSQWKDMDEATEELDKADEPESQPQPGPEGSADTATSPDEETDNDPFIDEGESLAEEDES